jgi:plastocyanin
MLKQFYHFDLMKKKFFFIIFLLSFIFIVGYITSSGLLSTKKNIHSPNISENKSGSFIAGGPIVSLLFNEGALESILIRNQSQIYEPAAKRQSVSDTLLSRDSRTNFTDSFVTSSGSIDENRTLDSNVIDSLTKIILSSIYNTNRTAEHKSSTKQFALTEKIEPQILSGNWTFRVDRGLIKNFKATFTMFGINGTERHVYELYNFRPYPHNFIHISSSQENVINGTIDIKSNGKTLWKDINCTLVITKDTIIKILLNSRSIDNQFNNQPIYGIIQSFKEIGGDQMIIDGLTDNKNIKSVIENRSNLKNNITQIIFGIINSANKQASHYTIARNGTGEKDLGQFYNNKNTFSFNTSMNHPIAQSHTNILIVKGADNPSNENFFYPQKIFVKPGSTVQWLNKDSAIHTVTSTSSEELITDYFFDTGFIQTGQLSKPLIMPQQDGVISYYCKIHPFMTGTLTIASSLSGIPYSR